MKREDTFSLLAIPLILFLIPFPSGACPAEEMNHSAHHLVSSAPPLWTVIPFILMLLGIAIIPLISAEWWESNRNKAIPSFIFGLFTLIYLIFFAPEGAMEKLAITMLDYVAFICLLAALFIIAGGIYIKGSLAGTPSVNTFILLIGSVLASFMGTTGAGMLLIRPLIRANSWRKKSAHIQVIFFIFLVTNIGGLLTPLGDPPIFLGFLKKVPFQWTFKLLPQWLFAVSIILAVFYIVDSIK